MRLACARLTPLPRLRSPASAPLTAACAPGSRRWAGRHMSWRCAAVPGRWAATAASFPPRRSGGSRRRAPRRMPPGPAACRTPQRSYAAWRALRRGVRPGRLSGLCVTAAVARCCRSASQPLGFLSGDGGRRRCVAGRGRHGSSTPADWSRPPGALQLRPAAAALAGDALTNEPRSEQPPPGGAVSCAQRPASVT